MNSKVCREKRQEILESMSVLTEKAKGEKRALTREEVEQFDNLDKAAEALLAEAEGFERLERFDGLTQAESRNRLRQEAPALSTAVARSQTEERNKALAGWFLHGSVHSKPEYWRAAERCGIDVASPCLRFDFPGEKRANIVGTGSAGGDLVAVDNQLMASVDVALKMFGGVRNVATIVRTDTGANLPWPTNDPTSDLGVLDAENSSINTADLTFGQKVLNAYRYDSKFIKVSWELMNDSVINLAEFIGERVGERIGRALNVDLTTGDGSGKPAGIVTGATSGGTSTVSGAISYADLLTLEHAVDPLYRNDPSCGFMMHDSTLKAIRALTDTNGRPLVYSALEGIQSRSSTGTLLGYPYTINQQMASFAAGSKCVLFGAFRKYIVRDVVGGEGGLNLIRLNERFADSGLVAWMAWSRHDGLLSDAGTHPVQYLTIHS